MQGAAHKSRRREHTRGNCLAKPLTRVLIISCITPAALRLVRERSLGKSVLRYLLNVSKAGRRKEGGGRGGTGVLERVQMLQIFKVEMRVQVFYKMMKLFHMTF